MTLSFLTGFVMIRGNEVKHNSYGIGLHGGLRMKKHMTLTILTASCILLCLGAFWDLKISTLFYDPHNIMGLFLQEGWPLLLKGLLTCCFALLMDQKHPLFSILWIVCAILFSHQIMTLTDTFWLSIGSMIVVLALTFLLCHVITPEQKNRVCPYIIKYLQLFFSVLIITTLIKVVWGRIRFRDLQQASQFCVWYLPCHEGGFSFPSGHTSSFACSLLFLLSLPHTKKYGISSRIIVWGCILLMMISRIIMGAHFLSDTVVGMLIAFIIWTFYDARWKKHIN